MLNFLCRLRRHLDGDGPAALGDMIHRDDPASIKIKLDHALSSPGTGIQSMLRGKPSRTLGLQWSVPIVLDMSALVPDGSHHYTKPEPGILMAIVETLREFGIVVVGLHSIPHELEREAIRQLGLPQFVSKGFSANATLKVRLEDVIHLVLKNETLCVPT